jgi:beta-glucosidase
VAASRLLLTEILKQEWGFQGFVVSDWNAVMELTQHGIVEDGAQAAARAISAGVDMDMVSLAYYEHLASVVRGGKVEISVLDEAVRRILRVKFLTGLFDHPFADPQRASRVMLLDEHRAAARRMAQESIVLLKNKNNLLPLGENVRSVAVFGPLANARAELFGTWTLDGDGRDVTPISDAIAEAAPQGVRVMGLPAQHDQAISLARAADVAVIVVGEHPGRSGEASSIATLDLPAGQREMIEAAHDNGLKIVLVVLAGRPVSRSRELARADTVLYAWHGGVEGGHGVADLLFGYAGPSGKLPISMPRTVGQVPVYYSRKNTGRPGNPGMNFTNGYIDLPASPLFPFGFGLSYTSFRYDCLDVSTPSFGTGGWDEFSAEITNTGDRSGTEVVQLYVRDLVGAVTRPVKELKGFQRVTLQPGEIRKVSFKLNAQDLWFAGPDDRPMIEPGQYHVWIGPSSAEGLQGEFKII